MSIYLLALAAALAVPQDPAPRVLEQCVLESVEEKDGAFVSTFKCPWPKGTVLRLEITRRTTQMSWAPRMEKDASGNDVERVNLAIQKRQRTVHREVFKVDGEGTCSYTWKPKVPGIYHLLIVYDPVAQANPDPKFRRENRTVHRIFALSSGQSHEIVVDDGREALRYSAEYFRNLRVAIQGSRNDNELELKMRPMVDEVLKRGETTQHPGTYSLMEHLSPYVMSKPKDPEKTGPDDPRVMSPNKIDIKTANLPPSIVRESLILAILMMEDAVEEAALLAPMPASKFTGDRRTAVERIAAELPAAYKDLRKLEPSSKLGYVYRESKFEGLVTGFSALITRMFEKREADEAAVKEMLEALKAAAKLIGHPFDSMKE